MYVCTYVSMHSYIKLLGLCEYVGYCLSRRVFLGVYVALWVVVGVVDMYVGLFVCWCACARAGVRVLCM